MVSRLPRQIALVLSQFPSATWSAALVSAVNQFAIEVVQAFRVAQPVYRELAIVTTAVVADSFPISFPVDSTPVDLWVAAVPRGDIGTSAVTVKWQPIALTGGQLGVSIDLITGLTANSTYTVRVGYR